MLMKIEGHVIGLAGKLDPNILTDKFLDFMEYNGWSFIGEIVEATDIQEEIILTQEEYNDEEIIDDIDSIEYLMNLQEKYYAKGDSINHAQCWKRINELLDGTKDAV